MATYTWAFTRNQIIDSVLRKLGVIGTSDSAEPEDSELVANAIDARLKELHALGVLWWQVAAAETSVVVTSGSATATITEDDFLYPVSLMLTSGTEQIPLEIIGHRQYQAIPDKATSGTPEKVFISGAVCRFWPVPTVTTTAELTYQAIADDSENITAIDIPVSMTRPFVDVIAGDLVDEFNVVEPKASRLLAKQGAGLRQIRILNTERVDTAIVRPEYY